MRKFKRSLMLMLVISIILGGINFNPSVSKAAGPQEYYWSKYNITQIPSKWERVNNYDRGELIPESDYVYYSKDYIFDQYTGRYRLIGDVQKERGVGFPDHYVEGKYAIVERDADSDYSASYIFRMHGISNHNKIYAFKQTAKAVEYKDGRGALIDSNIRAVQGTYPDDGIHSDGYWYVKTGIVPNNKPVLSVNSSDVTVNALTKDVKIQGTVLDADGDDVTIKASINGVEKTVSISNTKTGQPWVISWLSAELSEGKFSDIPIQAMDEKGGVDLASYVGTVTIDRTPPAAPSIQVDTTEWTNQDVSVNIISPVDTGSGISKIEYQLNGGSWDPYLATLVINSEGETTIKARAVDGAGNVSSEAIQVVKVVKTPPTAPLLTTSAGGWTRGSVRVTLSGSNGNSSYEYEYKINDGQFQKGQLVMISEEGTTKITGRAVNVFGMSSPESTITVTIDKTNPVISVTPNGRAWAEDEINVSVSVSDSVSGLQPNGTFYKVTKTPETPTDWELLSDPSIQIKNEGQWYIHVKATDLAGNTEVFSSSAFQLQNKPAQPTLHALDVQHNQVVLRWDLPAGYTDGYEYELQNTVTGATYRASYPSNQIIDGSVSGGREYEYILNVKNHVGQASSDTFKVLTKPDAPEFRVEKIDREYSRARLIIEPVQGATSYHVVIKDAFGNLLADETISNEYMIQGMEAGSAYQITASAENASGEGPSKSISYTSLPAVPGGFSAIQIRENSVDLEWLSVTSATYFNLERDLQTIYDGSGLSFADVGLDSGTSYDYRISAANENGEGQFSELPGVITLPGKLTDLRLKEAATDRVVITWPSIRGADGYSFELSDGQELSVTGAVYEAEFSGLEPGTTYTLTGYAQNRSGHGESTNFAFETLPVAVEGVEVSEIEEETATISWNPVPGAKKYRVIVDGTSYEVSGTSVSLTGLSGSKVNNFTVEAGNSSGYGAAVSGQFTTKPKAVSNLRVDGLSSNSIRLAWDDDETATQYFVQLEGSETPIELEVPVSEITGLEPGTSYVFDVWTQNATGIGKKTRITVTTKTRPVNPDDVRIVVEEDKVIIEFKPVENAKDYVLLDENGTEIWKGPNGPIVIEPITAGQEYNYEIVAVNDQGEKSDPTEIKFVAIPGIPDGIKVSNVTENSAQFDFLNANLAGAKEVIVFRDGKEIQKIKLPFSEGKQNFIDTSLKPDTEYKYEFVASNESGQSKPLELKIKTKIKETTNTGSGGSSADSDVKKPVKDPKPVNEGPGENQGNEGNHSSNQGSKFADVPDQSFAKEAIEYLAEQQIVKGVTDKMFEPDRPISRMEFAALIVRATNADPNNSLEITYKDINKAGWYMKELNAAISNEIAIGFNKHEFGPFLNISREQAAKMLGNVIIKQLGITESQDEVTFSDSTDVSIWADQEVSLTSGLNIIEGYPDGSFKPKGKLTRAESAVLIYRLLQKIQN